MRNQRESLLESNFISRARCSLRILNFTLFFCFLATTLAGGNLFLEYTLAVENGTAKELSFSPATKIYEGVYAAFESDVDRGIKRLAFDALPEMNLPPSAIARREAEKKIGVYIHMNNTANEKFRTKEIAKLQEIEHSTVVFDVKGSFVYFETNSEIAKKYGLAKSLYDLPQIVEELESAGIYTIARVIAVKDPQLAVRSPHTWLRSPWSSEPVPEWVDPTNDEVLEYNRQIISEIVAAGVDEINLDFIRYPDKFTSQWLGISGEEKIKNILNFVTMAREAIDSQKMDAVLSVDTFAILPWDDGRTAAALGQDITQLAEIADIIAPMLYPATFSRDNPKYYLKKQSHEYSTVFLTLKKYEEVLGENAKKLRPWIQGYYTTEQQMRDQIAAVFDAGICGFTVWDIQNDYTETYEILGEIELPENCK